MKFINGYINETEAGIYFAAGDFFLDPVKPVKNAIITHAHADHFAYGHQTIYCTPATADLLKFRFSKKLTSNFVIKDYHESFEINGTKIYFVSAGHILGSAQVVIETAAEKNLFTGDFKLQPDETCIPYEFVKADVLITESTFANPLIIHPSPEEEIKKINSFQNQNFLIGTYVLGKAQRLNMLMQKYCPDKVVMLHNMIVPFHRLYEQHSIKINNWIPYSRVAYKRNRNCIYLVPPVIYKFYYNQYKVIKAFASGWQRLQNAGDFSLYISDHADWNDLLKVIEHTQPKQLITMHGDGSELQKHFSASSMEVITL